MILRIITYIRFSITNFFLRLFRALIYLVISFSSLLFLSGHIISLKNYFIFKVASHLVNYVYITNIPSHNFQKLLIWILVIIKSKWKFTVNLMILWPLLRIFSPNSQKLIGSLFMDSTDSGILLPCVGFWIIWFKMQSSIKSINVSLVVRHLLRYPS